jgi:hypothetical protein
MIVHYLQETYIRLIIERIFLNTALYIPRFQSNLSRGWWRRWWRWSSSSWRWWRGTSPVSVLCNSSTRRLWWRWRWTSARIWSRWRSILLLLLRGLRRTSLSSHWWGRLAICWCRWSRLRMMLTVLLLLRWHWCWWSRLMWSSILLLLRWHWCLPVSWLRRTTAASIDHFRIARKKKKNGMKQEIELVGNFCDLL